ncbi:MAG: hypothetical protein HY332_23990 [Chloroflexi bacterium]|nr:hypothetical protein [Chloroflexota bacterium]
MTVGAPRVYRGVDLGSVRALTDGAGTVVQTYATDEFGVPIASGTQGSRTQPFGYTGEQRDAASGFVYLRDRYTATTNHRLGGLRSMARFVGWSATQSKAATR